ncbi:hypothetical protein [Haloarchaeobius litoreus]|uniref:Uncharacterized protein n=1 Tax=Haloarchaeobius litoreus TaxID=755306 RepID=A0ABD6DIK6_9EURY|nr:hypothetical protein [Haloarchaeobius litoreus]
MAKSLSDDAAAIPVIRYEIESTTDAAVAVSLRDTMPPGIDADDVGFHADYEADRWQKRGDGVEFRCPLGPNDRVETVVGLRTGSVPDPDAFATEPELTVLGADGSRTTSSGASVGGESDGASGAEEPTLTPDEEPADWERGMDLSSIERSFGDQDTTDASPENDAAADASDSGSAAEADDELPTLDLEEPAAAGPSTGDQNAPSDEESTDTATGSESDDGSATNGPRLDADDDVVGALVAAFRDDRVDEADRELLRNELNLELTDSTSSFVDHLQSRAKRKRDQLTEELDGLEDSITDLYGLKADASTVANVEERLDNLQDTAAEAERVQTLAASLRDLDERAASESTLADVVDRLDDLADDAARADDLERVAEAARELEERKAEERDVAALERSLASDIEMARDDLESAIDANRTGLDERIDEVVETHATTSELNELEGRVAKLRERVAELEEYAAAAADLRSAEDRFDTAISTLAEEVEALDERAAADADLTGVEETLRSDYVTEADVESVVETRLDQGVERFLALALGSGALISSVTVGATTSLTAAGAVAGVGVLLLAVWWFLGRQRTDPEHVGV